MSNDLLSQYRTVLLEVVQDKAINPEARGKIVNTFADVVTHVEEEAKEYRKKQKRRLS